MEEQNTPLEVANADDLAEMRTNSENDCSFGSGKEGNGVSMPICFLVKEQAKSLVAIQDLQRRLEHVENVQDDVIDAIVEIRNHICNDSRSFSSVNLPVRNSGNISRSPENITKLSPFSKLHRQNLPHSLSTLDVHPVLKVGSYSPKVGEYISTECRKAPSVTLQEHSQKIFDLVKSKDSALESDKQDSGLDSDCREHNDCAQSLNKDGPSWIKNDSNDELLHLLDEISQRSEILQKQIAAVEESTTSERKQRLSVSQVDHNFQHLNNTSEDCVTPKVHMGAVSKNLASENLKKSFKTLVQDQKVAEETRPMVINKHNASGLMECFEGKSVCDKTLNMKKRMANKIDGAIVSSVLKETNVVDLQRQVLIYLVENAVLQTKLGETEQMFFHKATESEKIENSLKDETRLLMMENRELRICLDEHKMEANALKSKMAMLERVLQSVTVENRELNWQLGESLGLQNLPKKEMNFSSSYTFGNPVSPAKSTRRSSLPSQVSCQNASSYHCTKPKLSNSSSFLDITIEESDSDLPPQVRPANVAFKYQNRPFQSSTPMLPLQKQKYSKPPTNSSTLSSQNNLSTANFHSIKRRLKSNYMMERENVFSSSKPEKCLEEIRCKNNIPESYAKNPKFSADATNETVPVGTASKFPFNSILEKLKSNSENRLSRRVSAAQTPDMHASSSDDTMKPCDKSGVTASQGRENISHCKDAKSQGNNQTSSEGSQDSNVRGRKGKNIHQRIQDILDRIVAESEEAS